METCKWNSEIDWIVVTEQDPPANSPPNVTFVRTTLSDFFARVGAAVGTDLSNLRGAYKLCDLKPTFGVVFRAEIAAYHSFGFNDLDVFFGNIRDFYTDAVLRHFDVISAWRRAHRKRNDASHPPRLLCLLSIITPSRNHNISAASFRRS